MDRRKFVAGLSCVGIGMPAWAAASPADGAVAASAAPATAAPAARPAKPNVAAAAEVPAPVTAVVADFVVGTGWSDLPAELIELGKKSILDSLGLALAGRRADTGPIVLRYLKELGLGHDTPGVQRASIIGTGVRVPPRFAAFANGIAIHADDFDDTQLAMNPTRVYGLLTHPSVTALPAALACAEVARSSGRDFMLAYHLGVEIETKIAEAIAPRHYEDGFHSTGTCGVFGAAVASAKVRGFDAARLRQALGIAAAQASGLRENFGTMSKPFQAGHAAEGGVAASDLAALGWSAADTILEARRGFFEAEGGGFDAAVMNRLGQPWTLIAPGVSIKPFPSGSLSHPGMTLLQQLIATQHIRAEEVAQVRVGASRQMLNTLIHHQPKTGLEAKFSMEFCIAILLVTQGRASLGDFQDEVVRRPDVQAMVARVVFYDNPAADAAGLDKMRTYIDIRLKDGRTISGQADYGKGSPQDPVTFDDVVEKFHGCADYARFPSKAAAQVVASVRTLEASDDIGVLVGLLRQHGA